MKVDGFDWDDGNWPKCGSHGVSKLEIEFVFLNEPQTDADPFTTERRFRAIGRSEAGRYIFVVYTLRGHEGRKLIRPISARFMHDKEVTRYDQGKA
jgi:uncharacterized DUF497 family protein